MWQLLQQHGKEFGALALTVFTVWLNRVLRARAKIAYSTRHSFTFLIDEPLLDDKSEVILQKQSVNTASIMLVNTGAETATGVEITFNWKPQFINIWPARHFETKESEHSRHTLVLESLAPKEVFGMELMSINRQLPALTSVRSNQCEGKSVEMRAQPIAPKAVIVAIGIFACIGLISTFYLLLTLLEMLFTITQLTKH